jgi:hypothetical protein
MNIRIGYSRQQTTPSIKLNFKLNFITIKYFFCFVLRKKNFLEFKNALKFCREFLIKHQKDEKISRVFQADTEIATEANIVGKK